MLLLEMRQGSIYLTTNRKADILHAIQFLTKEYQSMEDRGAMQTTIFETKPTKDDKVQPS
jgi:virulence-associated protein VapD